MDNKSSYGTNMIGAKEYESTSPVGTDKNSIHMMNRSYWDTIGNELLGAIVLPYKRVINNESDFVRKTGNGKGKPMFAIVNDLDILNIQ